MVVGGGGSLTTIATVRSLHCEPASNRDPVRFRANSLIKDSVWLHGGGPPVGADRAPQIWSFLRVFSVGYGSFGWGADSQVAFSTSREGASYRAHSRPRSSGKCGTRGSRQR